MAEKWHNIQWSMLEAHLRESIQQVYSEMEGAQTPDEIYRLQGEVRRLKKLLNLPGTLEVKYGKEGDL